MNYDFRLAEKALEKEFERVNDIRDFNQRKVLKAFFDNKVAPEHFYTVSGYGHDDLGREVLDKVFAQVFCAEKALVRIHFASGTHTLACALFGNLKYGDKLLSVAGAPYDTMQEVIGTAGDEETKRSSLIGNGVLYDEVPLVNGMDVDFAKLEESLKNAFSQNTLFDGQQALMDGSDSIFDQQQANSFIPSLMLEYISPRYEEESFKEIEESIQELTKAGELDGISAKITDKGLLLTFDDKYLFAPASAYLDSNARKLLDKVGVLICKKFVLHAMRIEGHTDSDPIHTEKYPSNWELSASRASSVVRYMINRFKFSPSLFSAIGYADTRPLETAISPKDPANRRFEILILKNRYKREFETRNDFTLNLTKAQQEAIQKQR